MDNDLVGSGKISKAAIVNQEGGVFAASPGYNVRKLSPTHVYPIICDPASLQISTGEQGDILGALKDPTSVLVGCPALTFHSAIVT